MGKRNGRVVGSLEKAYRESAALDEQLGLNKIPYITEEEIKMAKSIVNNEVTFKYGQDIAVVREVNGVVEVDRAGVVTPIPNAQSFDQVADQFREVGWVELPAVQVPYSITAPSAVQPTPNVQPVSSAVPEQQGEIVELAARAGGVDPAVATSAFQQNITIGVQQEVDAYLELHQKIADLTKELNGMKDNVREYMETHKVKTIKGTKGRAVTLQDATKSNSTSVYSDYLLEDLAGVVSEDVLKDVTEIRVNATKLDGVLKTGKLPTEKVKEVKGLKIKEAGTPRFTVKK